MILYSLILSYKTLEFFCIIVNVLNTWDYVAPKSWIQELPGWHSFLASGVQPKSAHPQFLILLITTRSSRVTS